MQLKPIYIVIAGLLLASILFSLKNKPVQKSALEVLFEDGKEGLTEDRIDKLSNIRNNDWHSQEVFWTEENKPILSAYFAFRAAKSDSTLSSWINAGSKMTLAFNHSRVAEENENLVYYLVEGGLTSYENASILAPENLDVKLGLATVLVDGKGDIMNGVKLLLEVAEVDSTNIEANLKLGRLSLVNGEFEKATKRFEKVAVLNPTNVEAQYTLASLAAAAGNREEAISRFEKAMELTTDSNLKEDIINRLNELKQ